MSTPFGELTVVVNPHAGRRHVGEEIPELDELQRLIDERRKGPADRKG